MVWRGKKGVKVEKVDDVRDGLSLLYIYFYLDSMKLWKENR